MGRKGAALILSKVDRCIFLEDDQIPSVSYFSYCAELLEKYKDDTRIDCICAMNFAGVWKNASSDYFFAEIILHSNCFGIFDRLDIANEISNNVIETDLWIKPGDMVNSFTSANYAIGTLVLRFDTEERLNEVMSNIDEYVKVSLKHAEDN